MSARSGRDRDAGSLLGPRTMEEYLRNVLHASFSLSVYLQNPPQRKMDLFFLLSNAIRVANGGFSFFLPMRGV